MSHVLTFQDRFEIYPNKELAARSASPRIVIRASDVREVRLQDAGFILGLDTQNLIFRVPAGQDLGPWFEALSTVFDASRMGQGSNEAEQPQAQQRRFRTLWSKDPRLPESQAATFSQLKAGSKVDEWITSPEEQPHCHGILGLQVKGKMARRYCALFQDRIDMWTGVEPVVSGRRPEDRIILENIRGIEMVFGGFILNFGKGRRIGVHVENADELRHWSAALASVVSVAGPPKTMSGGGGGPRSPRNVSSGMQCRKEETVKQTPRARSAGWVPKVATLAKKQPLATEGEDSSITKQDLSDSAGARKTLFTKRAVCGKPFLINTHKGGMQAGRHLHSNHVAVMVQGTTPGGRHLNPNIAEKINERPKPARLSRGVHADRILADKVTGTAPFISPRREPGSLNWLKCQHAEGTPPATTPRTRMEPKPTAVPFATVDEPHCPPSRRPVSPRPPGGYPVTGKVNEMPCRTASRSVGQTPRSDGLTVKITDQSRDGRSPRARQQSAPAFHKITGPPRERGGWT